MRVECIDKNYENGSTQVQSSPLTEPDLNQSSVEQQTQGQKVNY